MFKPLDMMPIIFVDGWREDAISILSNVLHSREEGADKRKKEIVYWAYRGKSKVHERVIRGLEWQFPWH